MAGHYENFIHFKKKKKNLVPIDQNPEEIETRKIDKIKWTTTTTTMKKNP